MNIKKLFIPLFVSLITGCYHNPFLADTYQPIHHDINTPLPIEEALYNTSYFLQSADLKSYELKEEIPGKNIVGTEVTTEIKTYTGFTFDEAHKDNVTRGIVAKDDSLQLKLYYNRNKYTVTFDKNSETATGEMEPQSFYYAVSAKLSTNSFINTGYVFTGWAKTANATEADFTDGYSISDLVTENNGNITLYAVWIEGDPIDYTIEYYLQTKDLSSYEKSKDKTLQNVADKEVTAQPESIDGFTFDDTHKDNITSGIVAEDGSLVLKLHYNRNKYTVTFDKNSKTASGEMEPQIFYYDVDETRKLNENKFTDEYHEFLGWAKSADTTKDIIKDAAELDFDITKSSDELSLYAVWSAADPAVIKELAVKIPDSDKDLEDKAVISTSRNISVTFSAENAVKIYYSLGEESKEIKEKSLDFADLTDGDYTFKIWAENIDGVKSEERTFSWTMACSPKLKIKGIPDSIIKIDTEVNIDVSGDNLESCSYSLNDGDSKEITLTDNAGKFTIKNNTAGDFTLTITGKNKLDETTEETFNWTVVETPVAVLSEIIDFMEIGTTQNITVSECNYYMYSLDKNNWSEVFPISKQISIENIANDTNTYNIYVVGGNTDTYSDINWQAKDTPTKKSWKIYPVYDGASLDTVLNDTNKVSGSGVNGKNIYAAFDENFVYFGYESQTAEAFSQGEKALCIAMRSNGAENATRYGIEPVDYIDETKDNAQPTFELNNQPLSHFLKITFDSAISGTAKFFMVNGGQWKETASEGIHFEIKEEGKCVLAIPRMLLAAPDAEVKYVVYMRNYTSKTIYAIYPEVSDYRADNYANVYTSNMDVMDLAPSSD